MASIVEAVLPLVIVCTIVIFYDCFSAWLLSRRVKKHFPKKASKNANKFKSDKFGKVIATLLKAYMLIIVAYLIQKHVFVNLPLYLPNIAAGAIIWWQGWSIIENESSCNNAKWAKVVQRIMIDKTARHLEMDKDDLSELLDFKDKCDEKD